jgi:molybdenum cofactor cytidylyltransferase
MTAAIILAAGRSTRMGQPKPLLRYEALAGHTFVSHLVEVFKTSSFTEILVVGRPDDDGLRAEVARCEATFIENRRPDEGQLSSLLAALSHLNFRKDTQVEAVLVTPVDAPLISTAVVARLMRAAAASPAQIIRATHAGKHGHPVIFRRSTFDELYAADLTVGARAVVRADPGRVEEVDMEDEGVTIDFDTPEEYRRYFGTPPSTNR